MKIDGIYYYYKYPPHKAADLILRCYSQLIKKCLKTMLNIPTITSYQPIMSRYVIFNNIHILAFERVYNVSLSMTGAVLG